MVMRGHRKAIAVGAVAVLAAVILAVLGSKGMLGGRKSGAGPPSSQPSSPPTVKSSSASLSSSSSSSPVDSQWSNPFAGYSSANHSVLGVNDPQVAHEGETLPADADKQASLAVQGDICRAANSDELKDAVENYECSSVQLTGFLPDAYYITKEILVSRRVSITGSPLTMPVIDANGASRAFRVKSGGFLELRYVHLIASEFDLHGKSRRRRRAEQANGQEGKGEKSSQEAESSQPGIIRGGGVYFEPGAIGGRFVGVYFLEDPDLEEGLEEAIELTLSQRPVYVYGGVILAAGGEIDFVSCLFWDAAVLLPLSPYFYVGGQVLMLAGQVTMTGCMFVEFNGFGVENGAGLNVAVLGGSYIVNFMQFTEVNLAVDFNAVGEALLVGGGVALYTGFDFIEFSFLLLQTGTGMMTVLGGVQIMTGFNIFEGIGAGAFYGAGMEFTTGAGVTVFTGCNIMENNGLFAQMSLGEMIFTGTGVYVSIGSVHQEFSSMTNEGGMGNFVFLGSGVATLIGTVFMDASSMTSWFGNGEFISQGAGFMVFYGGFFMDVCGIEGFFGLGVFSFIGAGALYIDAWWDLHEHPIVTPHSDIWVDGGCSPVDAVRRLAVPLPIGSSTTNAQSQPRLTQEDELVGGIPKFLDGSFGCVYEPAPAARRLNLENGVNRHTRTLQEFASGSTRRRQRSAVNVIRATSTNEQQPPAPSPEALHQLEVGLFFGPNHKELKAKDTLDSVVLSAESKKFFASAVKEVVKEVERLDSELERHRRRLAKKKENGGEEGTPQRKTSSVLHIERAPKGSCNVFLPPDMVSGEGAEACHVQDPSDTSLTTQPSTLQTLLRGPEAGEQMIDYTPYILVNTDLEITTSGGIEMSEEAVHNAAIEAVEEWQRGVTNDTIYVQVFSSNPSLPDSAIQHLTDLEPFQVRRRSLKGTTEMHSYKAVFVVTSESVSEQVQGGLQEIAAYVLGMLRRDNKAAGSVEGVSLTWEKLLAAPAYKQEAIGQGGIRHLGSHTVVMVDPDVPAMPITHLEHEKEYLVHMEVFTPHACVLVQLMRVTGHGTHSAVASVADVKVDHTGTAQVRYQLRRTALRPGDYLLQASASDGSVLSHSPIYTLTHTGVERRLFGASLYV